MSVFLKQLLKKNARLESLSRKIYAQFRSVEQKSLTEDFIKFFELLESHELKSREEIQNYQLQQLQEITKIAYYHTDFYKEKYLNSNFHPDDLETLEDIKKIPVLTGSEVRKHKKQLVNKTIPQSEHLSNYTSGTTGRSLEIHLDKKSQSRELASVHYIWKKIGYKLGEGRVEFRGFLDNKYDYLHLPDHKILRINIVKLGNHNIDKIINKIKELNYNYLHGYPSAISKFAKLVQNNLIQFKPSGIMLASEILFDWQFNQIKQNFNCPIVCHYGQAERVALAFTVNQPQKYSFIPTYGLVEINQSNNCLISTGFINQVMPLIRYQLNDSVIGFRESESSSLFPIVDGIEGRLEDITYSENKDPVPPALVTFPFKKLQHISAAQIIQHSLNQFELILETGLESNDLKLKKEKSQLISELQSIYGKSSVFKTNLVNQIPLSANGKFRWVECKIPN